MMPELKPCPFCGATESTGMVHDCVVPVESFMKREIIEFYSVQCFCCGCRIGNHNTKEGAIAAWNRRADNG